MRNFFTIAFALIISSAVLAQPGTPNITGPATGSQQTWCKVLVDWDPVFGGVNYRVQYDTDRAFGSPSSQWSGPSSTWLQNMEFNSKMYWRVKAYDASNDSSAWSSIDSFLTMNASMIVLEKPVAEQTIFENYVKGSTDDNVFTLTNELSWEGVCPSAILEMSTNLGFTSPVASTINDTSHWVMNLDYDQKYWWRIRFINATDSSAWSAVDSFKTKDAPHIINFPDSALDVAPSNTVMDSTLSFKIKPYFNSDNYQFQIDTTPNFNSTNQMLITRDSTFVTEHNTPHDLIFKYWKPVNPLKFGYQYHWRVRALNSYDTSSWTPTRTFWVWNQPVHQYPANGAVLATKQPYCKWIRQDGIDGYTFMYATNPAFTGATMVNIPQPAVNDSAYFFFPNPLTNGTTYHWRVQGYLGVDSSSWSVADSFQISPTAGIVQVNNEPGVSIYPTPADEVVNVNLNALNASTKVELIDVTGNLIEKRTLGMISSRQIQLDVSELPPGMYFVKVTYGDEHLSKRMIVR